MPAAEELPVDHNDSRLLYIGTADQSWLRRTEAAWCISRNHLGLIPPRARGPYILDSGAFTELDRNGDWTITPKEYVKQLDFWYFRPGRPDYIGPLDWPCEEQMLAKTKKTVYQHQKLTVGSFLETTDRWNWSNSWGEESRVIPALQADTVQGYLRCVDMYLQEGVPLGDLRMVGLGSVCRRQSTSEIVDIVSAIVEAVPGIRLHGFGVKILGLRRIRHLLHCADTFSWSYDARHAEPLPGCHTHKRCVSCIDYALDWYGKRMAEFPDLGLTQKTPRLTHSCPTASITLAR